jgi:hypothetical protein
MPENIFSPLINGEVSHARRVWHSTTNYFSTIDLSPSNVAAQTANTASNFAGVAGGVGGAITIQLGEAAAAGLAGAGFLAAIAGPQVAVTAAVVSVALLAKGAYSNREAAHRKLSEYVWNLIDDTAPAHGRVFSQESLDDAADAATTLLDDGKNQLKLLGTKLQSAQQKFRTVNQRFETFVQRANRLKTSPGWRTPSMRNRVLDEFRQNRDEARAVWEKEIQSGGAIFEYVRRCAHTGNYLQAPHIISLALKQKISPGSVVGATQPDFFAGMTFATNSRGAFTTLDAAYKSIFG